MCLIIKGFKLKGDAIRFSKKPEVAKEDIIVYKVILSSGYPLYRERLAGFKYEKGFHYYQTGNKPFTFDYGRVSPRNWALLISVGLHSCKTRQNAKNRAELGGKVVKMIIPKGAKYFENDTEYVSDQLIYI